MEEYIVRQGDQYFIPFQIKLDDSVVTDDLINGSKPEYNGDVEIVIGKLRKTYQKGELKFNRKTFTFDFPYSQEETLALRGGMILKSQVRVKLRRFRDDEANTIYSYEGPIVRVISSLSKEKL